MDGPVLKKPQNMQIRSQGDLSKAPEIGQIIVRSSSKKIDHVKLRPEIYLFAPLHALHSPSITHSMPKFKPRPFLIESNPVTKEEVETPGKVMDLNSPRSALSFNPNALTFKESSHVRNRKKPRLI